MAVKAIVLPIFLLVAMPVFCLITYAISVKLGHVNTSFPYISDTGTYPPESCIFGFVEGLYALMSAICIYIRYRQVDLIYKDASNKRVFHKANMAALITGFTSSLGLFIVANFQETTVHSVHLTGAALAFIGGVVYCWIQTVITYKAPEVPGYKKTMAHIRLLLSLLLTLSFVVVITTAAVAMDINAESKTTLTTSGTTMNGTMVNTTTPGTTHTATSATTSESSRYTPVWHPSDPGYSVHVVSAALEWVLALLTAAYFATFAKEFTHFHITLPEVEYINSFNLRDTSSDKQQSNGFSNPSMFTVNPMS